MRSLLQWIERKTIAHDVSHVRNLATETLPRAAAELGSKLARELQARLLMNLMLLRDGYRGRDVVMNSRHWMASILGLRRGDFSVARAWAVWSS